MASLEDEFAVRAVVTRYSDVIMCRDPAADARKDRFDVRVLGSGVEIQFVARKTNRP